MTTVEFSVLEGQTITSIDVSIDGYGDTIIIKTEEGNHYKLCHIQDCCEKVTIEDINGVVGNILDHPVIKAEVLKNQDIGQNKGHERFTWSYYHISTIKETLTIRWYGGSNGYYSEEVSFIQLNK